MVYALLLAATLSAPVQAWSVTTMAWDMEAGPVTWYLVGSDAFPAEGGSNLTESL